MFTPSVSSTRLSPSWWASTTGKWWFLSSNLSCCRVYRGITKTLETYLIRRRLKLQWMRIYSGMRRGWVSCWVWRGWGISMWVFSGMVIVCWSWWWRGQGSRRTCMEGLVRVGNCFWRSCFSRWRVACRNDGIYWMIWCIYVNDMIW